ncbi:hypothetical protein D9M68_775440 [compost metagenome]
MEVDRIGALLRLHVVNAAEEIVGMAVQRMRRPGPQCIGPAASDAERGIDNLDEREHFAHGRLDVTDQDREFRLSMQCVSGLPGGAFASSGARSHERLDLCQQIPVEWFVARRFEPTLPDEGREQAYDLGSGGRHGCSLHVLGPYQFSPRRNAPRHGLLLRCLAEASNGWSNAALRSASIRAKS